MPKKLLPADPGGPLARAQLAAILESSEDAIIRRDLEGTITGWNKAAEVMFGYRADESMGRPVSMLVSTEYLDEAAEFLERTRRGEQINRVETVRRRKDGSLLSISLTISPLRDPQGKIVGASEMARDITERIRGGIL